MNNHSIVSRVESQNLPTWGANAPGYIGMEAASPAAETPRGSLHIGMAIKRYWWLVILIWAVIAIPASILCWKYIPPKFHAVGGVTVNPTILNPINDRDNVTPFYQEYLHTQADLMRNPYVLQRASEDPRLENFAWFRQLPDKVGWLQDHIEVIPGAGTGSQNISVSLDHQDPAAATAIIDSIIYAYTRVRQDSEKDNVDANLKILTGLRDQTEKFLIDNQTRLATLQANVGGAMSDENRRVVAEVLTSEKTTLSKLESDRLNLQAQVDALTSRTPPDEKEFKDSIPTDNDPQIDQWMKEKIDLQLKDKQLETFNHETTGHPERVAIRKQVTALDAKVAARRTEIQSNAWANKLASFNLDRNENLKKSQADLAGLDEQIADLKTNVENQEKISDELGQKAEPIAALKDTISEEKDALKRYTDRIEQIENQVRAPGRVTEIGPTVVRKTPDRDSRPKAIAGVNAVGLLLGIGVMMILMKLRNRIEHPDDLPEAYQPLVVGTVSHAGASVRGLHSRMNRKILGEEMRLLHANLLPPGRGARKIMMVTSPTPANGKTSISAQLAISLAKSGLNVLLIDADLRKRDLTTMYDVGFRAGLAELLMGQAPELVSPIELLPNLRVMGAGAKLDRNPVELFQRREFLDSINLLQDKFDVIVVDTPPALVVADARLIARSCDEVLCVVRMQVSSPKEVNQTLDALSRATGKTPKIIVNGVAHRQSYYKYKFTYADDGADDTLEHSGHIPSTTPTTTVEATAAEVAAEVK